MLGTLITQHEEFRRERDASREWAKKLELRLMGELSLERLKALWDSWDGTNEIDPVIDGDMVHAELNRRGHGEYCAV